MHALPRLEKDEGGGNCFEAIEPFTPQHVFHAARRMLCQLVYRKRQRISYIAERCSYIAKYMLKRHARLIVT
jgi:hypothetical protein